MHSVTETSFRLSDWRISRIEEMALELPAEMLIPSYNAEELRPDELVALAPTRSANGRDLRVPIHSWLLQKNDLTILVDTGVGNGRNRNFGAFAGLETDFLDRLAARGAVPEKVDFVLCTHLHTDHVGWNTRADGAGWRPTFPNARYVWGRIEGAIARQPFFQDGLAAGVYADSIAPILEAGLAEEVGPGSFAAVPGITFHSTPGHSPGHMSISLSTEDGLAFFGGDVLHSQIQVSRPDWNSTFCEDPATAARSRRWALEYCADNNALFFGTHIGGSSVGRVHRGDAGFLWTHE